MRTATTRRTLVRGLLAGLLSGLSVRRSSAAALPGTGAGPRALLLGFRRNQIFERRYRADAAVIFCGVTIFTRRGVGGGRASVESGSDGSSTATALRFVAGSDPARCAGLNRFGILEEAVIDSAEPSFAFAGLITDSKEEDLDSAKKALRAAANQQVKVARGTASGGRVRAWTEIVDLARPCTWRDSTDLLASFAQEAPRSPARELAAEAGPFLSAIRSSALSEDPSTRRPFVHAGKLYSLELHSRSGGERDGIIRDENRTKAADFRVAYAPNDRSGLPVRIEYRAKPYLKLVFEVDDSAAQPNVPSLFPQE